MGFFANGQAPRDPIVMNAEGFRSPGLSDAALATAEYPDPNFFSATLAESDPELARAIGKGIASILLFALLLSARVLSRFRAWPSRGDGQLLGNVHPCIWFVVCIQSSTGSRTSWR